MGRSRVLQEVLVMRFEEIYGRFSEGRLNCEEASDLLGISVSSFRRRRRRYEEAPKRLARPDVRHSGWPIRRVTSTRMRRQR